MNALKFNANNWLTILITTYILSTIYITLYNPEKSAVYFLSAAAFISIVIYFPKVKYTTEIAALVIIVSSLFLGLLIHEWVYDDGAYRNSVLMIVSPLIGYIIAPRLNNINTNNIYYLISAIFIIFIIYNRSIATENYDQWKHVYFNRVYNTYFITVMTQVWLFVAVKDYIFNNDVDVRKVFIFLVISILSQSRFGLIASVFFFSIYALSMYRFSSIMLWTTVFITAAIVVSMIWPDQFLYLIVEPINESINRGMQTGRVSIYADFLEELNFRDILFGLDRDVVNTILASQFDDEDTHTLHNSFLELYSRIGIFSVLILLIITYTGYMLIKCKPSILFLSVIFIYLVKANLDRVVFGSKYDFMFYTALFLLIRYITMRFSNNKIPYQAATSPYIKGKVL